MIWDHISQYQPLVKLLSETLNLFHSLRICTKKGVPVSLPCKWMPFSTATRTQLVVAKQMIYNLYFSILASAACWQKCWNPLLAYEPFLFVCVLKPSLLVFHQVCSYHTEKGKEAKLIMRNICVIYALCKWCSNYRYWCICCTVVALCLILLCYFTIDIDTKFLSLHINSKISYHFICKCMLSQ